MIICPTAISNYTGTRKGGNPIKTHTTKKLEWLLLKYSHKQGYFGCHEVTVGWSLGSERVDFLAYDQYGDWRFYEIKVSKQDFHSKSRTTFKGDYNYYVMPEELFKEIKSEIPEHIGVMVPGGNWLRSVKPAKRVEKKIDDKRLSGYLIRSLYRVYYENTDMEMCDEVTSKRSMNDILNYPDEGGG